MTGTGRLSVLNAKTICCLLVAVWAYAFWPSIKATGYSYWHSGYDHHGFLVLPLILLQIVQNRSSLKRANIAYNSYGLLLLLFFAFTWLASTLLEVQWAAQISMLAMLIAIVLTTFGRKITSILALPLACLFLLLPIGQPMYAAIVQSFAWALMHALTLCRQAVYWDANNIVANNHAYNLAAYLGSMQYGLLFLSAGICYATLKTKNWLTSLTIQISFLVMPLITLWLSLFCYIMMSRFFTSPNLVVHNLNLAGWILTGIGLLHACILGLFIRDPKGLIHGQDNIDWRDHNFAKKRSLLPLSIGAMIMLMMPGIANHVVNTTRYKQNNLLLPPKAIAKWQGQTLKTSATLASHRFKKSQEVVNLTIAQSAEMIEPAWKKVKEAHKTIKLNNSKLPVSETIFHDAKNKYKVLWQVNYVNGHYTNNPAIAKVLAHLYSMSGNGAQSGVLSVSTDVTSELGFARERLKTFMQDFTDQSIG